MSSTRRILVGTPYTVTHVFYGDETAVDADGAVTVTITKADGTAVVTNAATTHGAANSGAYSYAGNAVATLEHLTLTWSGTFSGKARTETDYADIVGGFHVSLVELRAEDSLSSTTDFPTQKLRDARDWWEELAESYCGQPFVPRYRRVRLSGTGRSSLLLPDADVRTIRTVRTYSDGVTYTSFSTDDLADLAATSGVATRLTRGAWTAGTDNLVIEYEAGPDSCPVEIHDAALIAIRSKLLQDNTGRPMLSVATADGVVRFAMPGPDRPTGYPDADVVLLRKRLIPVG